MIIPIKRQPIIFLESGEVGHNQLSGDCSCKGQDFYQLSECGDRVSFQVDLTENSIVGWAIKDIRTGQYIYVETNEEHVEYTSIYSTPRASVSFIWSDVLPEGYTCDDGCYEICVFDIDSENFIIGDDESQLFDQEVSGELVDEGDFDLGLTDIITNGGFASGANWTAGGKWSIGSGVATHTAGAGGELSQTVGLLDAQYYQFKFQINTFTAGSMAIYLGDAPPGTPIKNFISTVGTGVKYALGQASAEDENLYIGSTTSLASVIDNVKLHLFNQYVVGTSGKWQFPTNAGFSWDSDNLKAIKWDNTITGLLKQLDILSVGKAYKITFTVSGSASAGTLTPMLGSTNLSPIVEDGTYTMYGICTGSDDLQFSASTTWLGSIDDVSVKEIITVEQALNNGQFSISEDGGGYCSEPFNVKQAHSCTKLLMWRNDENAFGFNYEDFTLYLHSMRVRSKLWQMTFRKNKKVFTDSAGDRDIRSSVTTEAVKFTIDDSPLYIHQALAIALEHDYFEVDGVPYVNEEEEYNPLWRKSSLLAPSTVELIEDGLLLENKSCQ